MVENRSYGTLGVTKCFSSLGVTKYKGTLDQVRSYLGYESTWFFDQVVPQSSGPSTHWISVGKKGLEPLTLRLSGAYSNQLSYLPLVLFWTMSVTRSLGVTEL